MHPPAIRFRTHLGRLALLHRLPHVPILDGHCKRRHHDHIFRDVHGGGEWNLEDRGTHPVPNPVRNWEQHNGLHSLRDTGMEGVAVHRVGTEFVVPQLYLVQENNFWTSFGLFK